MREAEIKTNPNKSDSDNDGLSDCDEVIIWKTDPLNADTDGDGFKDCEEIIGNQIRVKVIKNKVGSPFRTAEFNLIFGEGIDTYMEVIEASVTHNVAEKSGSWFSYNGDKLGQGREGVKQLLKDNPELYLELKTKVEEKIYTN